MKNENIATVHFDIMAQFKTKLDKEKFKVELLSFIDSQLSVIVSDGTTYKSSISGIDDIEVIDFFDVNKIKKSL